VASDRLAGEVAGIVGAGHVLTDPDLRAPYETDWTRRWSGRARFVVRPADTAEVATVVAVCAAAGAPVVPQGGNTGLVGGAVPRAGQVLLSLTRLRGTEPVDEDAAQVGAQAGVTLAALQRHAAGSGWDFGVDLAARDSATLGGMVATNAGGIHVLRYGPMRRQLLGVEAVLADGRVLRRLAGLEKDNAGYDLTGLLAGSEGTLAVITATRLRLVPRAAARVVVLLALNGTAAALAVLRRVRRRVAALEAAELFYGDGLELVRAHAGLPPPFRASHPAYLLLEAAAADPGEELGEALAGALDGAPEVDDVAVADDRAAREALWAYRERHTEAVAAAGVPHKLDVSVPLGRLAEFESAVRRRVAEVDPHAWTILWGHCGDGNLHVNVLGPAADDDRVDEAVLALAASLGGSIAAEHGIGAAKRRWLHLCRDDADRATMRAVKAAFDPAGLLNPGVLFD
jgi:FAD/FMN-containing dehydrogenase